MPLISPSCAGRQMFVQHPDVSAYLRRATAKYLIGNPGPLGVAPDHAEAFHAAVDELGAKQLAATAGHLAAGLPVFDVEFAADGSFEVSAAS